MKTKPNKRILTALGAVLATTLIAFSASAQTLKASHQWPGGGKGDVRDEMVQIIAREIAKADVGLEV